MTARTAWDVGSTAGAALRGALLGLALTLAYGLAFALYAIVRSSLQIVAVLPPDEGLLGTLVANALSILVPTIVVALLLAAIPAILEAIVLVAIYRLCLSLRGEGMAGRSAIVGLVVSLLVTVVIHLLGWRATGAYFAALWPMGYLFWLGLPSMIFVTMNTWAGWRLGGGARSNATAQVSEVAS
jgi:hypothetical protein